MPQATQDAKQEDICPICLEELDKYGKKDSNLLENGIDNGGHDVSGPKRFSSTGEGDPVENGIDNGADRSCASEQEKAKERELACGNEGDCERSSSSSTASSSPSSLLPAAAAPTTTDRELGQEVPNGGQHDEEESKVSVSLCWSCERCSGRFHVKCLHNWAVRRIKDSKENQVNYSIMLLLNSTDPHDNLETGELRGY